jgi:RimJ/RimL family protein N-acetyltransferase
MTAAPFEPRPVVLEDEHVRVEPLTLEHAGDLLEAGREEDVSGLTPRPPFTDLDVVRAWIAAAHAAAETAGQIPFAIVERAGGAAVGSTRFLDIQPANRSLEIGYTWIGRRWQRTAVNTACKLLLLTHVFETLRAHRVQFKTDRRNERSQRALEGIGAVFEGILRRNMVLADGFVRDSVYYSVIDAEWPEVRELLRGRLRRASGSG